MKPLHYSLVTVVAMLKLLGFANLLAITFVLVC